MDYVDTFLMHWPFCYQVKRQSLVFRIAVESRLIGKSDNLQNENEYAEFGREDYTPFTDTWRAMEECVRQGYAKSIGVCNFNENQLETLLKMATIKPVINQVRTFASCWEIIYAPFFEIRNNLFQIECHPYLNQKELVDYCSQHDIVVMAFCPLYAPYRNFYDINVFNDATINDLTHKHNKQHTQITLRYLVSSLL